MTVLVAGASGFIGRHVVRALGEVAPDTPVVRLDRQAAREVGASAYYRREIGGGDGAALTRLLRECDVAAIVNCAGTTQSQAERLAADNVATTEGLIEASAAARAGMVFCQIGSAAEYEMLPRPDRTREDCPTRPAGDYGRSKLAASNRVLEATRQGHVAGYVLRLFNPIGAGMPTTQLVGRLLEHLRNGPAEPLVVGSLSSYRDYVDARDVARAIAASLPRADALRGEVINVGSGTANSTRSLVQGILRAARRGAFLEEAEGGSARSQWASWQEADISKARVMLGWVPRFSFDETLQHLAAVSRGDGHQANGMERVALE